MNKTILYVLIGFGVVVFSVVIALIIYASKNQPTKTDDKSQLPDDQRTVLNVWRPIDDQETFQTIIDQYEKEHPEIKINYVKSDLANYEFDSISAQLGENGPDVWSIPSAWLIRHKEKLAPMPAGFLAQKKEQAQDPDINTKQIRDSYVPVVEKEVIFDNLVYGLPLFVDTLALVANQDIFNEVDSQTARDNQYAKEILKYGPKNWNEFIDLIKLLTKKNGNQIERAAAALGASSNIENSADILALLMMQNNTQLQSSDKKQATFNLDQEKTSGENFNPGKNAVEFYTNFANPASQYYTWNESMPDDFDAFSNGKVAMIFSYASQLKKISEKNPNLKFVAVAMPQIKNQSKAIDMPSYWVETVPATSKKQVEAWNFILYTVSNGLGNYLNAADRPNPTPIKSVPEISERVKKNNPWQFQQQTAESWYRGNDPQKVELAYQGIIKDVLSGGSVQNALDTAASKVSEIFKTLDTTP
ncbi:MAG: Uncharacterized protein CEN89_147 [Candidatus Berkelbacteria bacterium Licking1014_7]|uniref:Multiple sugar transport system substrate-binding protein n=1 Tax=Candidatus Berkelbacteria bacterium Licking1014_7 TaxID=2017147 RepID=A0A554LK47_9BACT|nr:MAG: Uncharacterized protein CEN89_147 [Candidatus Berkelbacteria bacterium Licking1014_7]